MKSLSSSELELMEYIWKLEKSFLNDLISAFPEPRPAKTTVATLLKRMQDKAYVGYNVFGNSRQYFPLVEKEDYFADYFKSIVFQHFNDSFLEFGLFLFKNPNLNQAELEEIKESLDFEINKNKSKEAVFY